MRAALVDVLFDRETFSWIRASTADLRYKISMVDAAEVVLIPCSFPLQMPRMLAGC
jgi:hypothetical protein